MCHGMTSFNVVIRNEEREVTTDLLLRMLNTKRYIFLHLRVTQKALQLPVWLFFFSPPSRHCFSDGLAKGFFYQRFIIHYPDSV